MKGSADYRALARNALQGKWKTAVLTGLAASALGASIVNGNTPTLKSLTNQNPTSDPQGYLALFSQPKGGKLLAALVVCTLVWVLLTIVVGGAAQLGYARFNLNLADGKNAAFSDLLSQKSRLWDGFCMKFLQGLYITLWSLLFLIPGIVKFYSYAMTPYIMAEHPTLTANEAITESRRIMDGNKWRLFCLNFSFLGWELLCLVPLWAGTWLIVSLFSSWEAVCVSLVILMLLPMSIGFFFLHPYEEAAWAVFYRDITAMETSEL